MKLLPEGKFWVSTIRLGFEEWVSSSLSSMPRKRRRRGPGLNPLLGLARSQGLGLRQPANIFRSYTLYTGISREANIVEAKSSERARSAVRKLLHVLRKLLPPNARPSDPTPCDRKLMI